MARFYGFSHAELMDLDVEWVETYWLAITTIEAQEALVSMRIADFPYLKPKDREKWHRELHTQAFPRTHSGKTMTTEELAAHLRGLIG